MNTIRIKSDRSSAESAAEAQLFLAIVGSGTTTAAARPAKSAKAHRLAALPRVINPLNLFKRPQAKTV